MHTNGHYKSSSHCANMQINHSHSAKKILVRLKKMLKVRTDIELSKIMDVSPSTISTWKKRDSLDYSLVLDICKLYKIDLNFLFNGEKWSESNNSSAKIPLITKEILHEYIIGEFKNNLSDLPHYHLPFIHGGKSIIFQVISNDLAPILEENDFAICERKQISEIHPEDLTVVVSKKKGFFISNLRKEEDSLILLNKITPHTPRSFPIKIALIDEIWTVKGKISYNLKLHSVRSKAK